MADDLAQEKKLPRWAQDRLTSLRYKAESLERELNIARQLPGKGSTGKVIADSMSGLNSGFPLHDCAQVDFKLPYGTISVGLREDGNVLSIMGSGVIYVLPRAANVIHIVTSKT